MKIEVGESLLLSWLRHVKTCQLTQLNWKPSSKWSLQNKEILQDIFKDTSDWYLQKTGMSLYKGTKTLKQLLGQAEVDVIGISFHEQGFKVYAVDVAFHESGLVYGITSIDTETILIKKFIRSAMCILGYFGPVSPTIFFASPKIPIKVHRQTEVLLQEIKEVIAKHGLLCDFQIIGNSDFNDQILQPILNVTKEVADTSELFMRSIQLYKLFGHSLPVVGKVKTKLPTTPPLKHVMIESEPMDIEYKSGEGRVKIGVLARTELRSILESGTITEEDIMLMQTKEYSKATFHINLPILKATREAKDKTDYYADPVKISGKECGW